MRHRISIITKFCDSCQRNKVNTQPTRAPMINITPERVNQLVSVDFYGPLPKSTGGVEYIFELIDVFSKFVVLYPIKKANTFTVIKKLEDFFLIFGKPETLQVDNGSQFMSKKLRSFLRDNQVNFTASSITHPQSNTIERVNREIGRMCRSMIKNKHSEWACWIPFIQNCLNNIVHDTTEFTPHEIKWGKKPVRFWETFFEIKSDFVPYEKMLVLARDRIRNKGEKRKEREDKKYKLNLQQFELDELVLVKTNKLSNKFKKVTSKFLSIYVGPYKISRKINDVIYEVSEVKSGKVRGKFHVSNIKKYYAK